MIKIDSPKYNRESHLMHNVRRLLKAKYYDLMRIRCTYLFPASEVILNRKEQRWFLGYTLRPLPGSLILNPGSGYPLSECAKNELFLLALDGYLRSLGKTLLLESVYDDTYRMYAIPDKENKNPWRYICYSD